MLLQYLRKLKNQKSVIFMHVKHVSNVTFLSPIQQIKEMPNVVKDNTMQKYQHFTFCSFDCH